MPPVGVRRDAPVSHCKHYIEVDDERRRAEWVNAANDSLITSGRIEERGRLLTLSG